MLRLVLSRGSILLIQRLFTLASVRYLYVRGRHSCTLGAANRIRPIKPASLRHRRTGRNNECPPLPFAHPPHPPELRQSGTMPTSLLNNEKVLHIDHELSQRSTLSRWTKRNIDRLTTSVVRLEQHTGLSRYLFCL